MYMKCVMCIDFYLSSISPHTIHEVTNMSLSFVFIICRPSFRQYRDLDLSANPIILKPGEIRGIYIHSTHESDQALVYDNQEHVKTHDDNFITVLPGRAHVSTEVFGTRPIWGWGNAWRDNREFVGKISYGVVYKLWNPSEHLSFGKQFRRLTTELLMCQRRWESPFSMLSDDCIFYILNMCRWDWMNDSFNELRSHKKRLKQMAATSSKDGAKDIQTSKESQSGNTTEGFKCHSTNLCHQRLLNNREQENRGLFYSESEEEEEYEEEDEDDDDDEEEYDDEDDDDEEEDDDDEESEPDDGYDDHRGSSAFQFFYYDDLGSSEEEREAEAFRERQERRRLLWMRAHFGHQILTILNRDNDMEDEDNDSE